jgi:hypothetical protein
LDDTMSLLYQVFVEWMIQNLGIAVSASHCIAAAPSLGSHSLSSTRH